MASINVQWAARRALYTIPSEAVAYTHKLVKGESYPVFVHGLFQIGDENEYDAYFICELEDGRCCYANPSHIRFIDGGPPVCE